jgi:hypothetical protein
MAAGERRQSGPTVQPPGVEGEGLDPYPTYRDGPTVPHRVTATKPTDVGLPRSRRTYALPILIGLVVFALVILLRLVWGGINVARSTDDALSPGDAANPPAASEAAPAAADAPGVEAEAPPASGETEATPGAVDVPGGATTDQEAPAAQ